MSIGKIASFGRNFAKGLLDAQCVTQRCSVSETDGVFTMVATGHDAYFGEVRMPGQSRNTSDGKLFSVNPGKKIYFKSMNGVFDKSYIQQWDQDLNSLGFLDGNSVNGKDLAAGTKYISLRIGINNSVAGTTYTDKIMLSFDPITEWEEPYYEEKSVSLDLYSLPDGTCDEMIGDKLIRRVGKAIFDGSNDENWSLQNPENPYFGISLPKESVIFPGNEVGNAITNRFVFTDANSAWAGRVVNCASLNGAGASSRFRIRLQGVSTIDAFKVWLQTHPVNVYYELATPITETIDIPIIPTHAPYTTISHDSPIETEVEYEILTKSDYAADIIDIKQRLAALENAAIE